MSTVRMFDLALLRVMAITDGLHDGIPSLVARVQAAVRGGATCVQVRLKDESARTVAEAARAIIAAVSVPVLVNDRFDVALAAGAAGVHVGADDVPTRDVRRLTPPGFLIGTSVGCDAEVPNAHDADFVGIGPIFSTQSKADAGNAIGLAEFTRLAAAVERPAIGIGGVRADNAASVIRAGGAGVAAIHSVFGAGKDLVSIEAATRAIANAVADARGGVVA